MDSAQDPSSEQAARWYARLRAPDCTASERAQFEEWRASDLFSERERVTLEYAEAITRSDLEVSDELMARLRQQFDDDTIVELTALIAFQNMSSKFNAALDVPPQGFCRLPEPLREAGGAVSGIVGRSEPPGFRARRQP